MLSDTLSEVKENFYSFKQVKCMSLWRYYKLFLAQVQVLDEVRVPIAGEDLVKTIA